MGEKPLLRGRQGVQQKRQGDRGGELRAGGQRVRSIPEQCISAVTREYERGVVATLCAGVTGAIRATEVDGTILTAAVTASVVGHRVHRQRHHVRQLRPIIPWSCKMPSLYLRAMGRTLKRKEERETDPSRAANQRLRTKHDDRYLCREERNVSEAFCECVDIHLLENF